MEYFVKMQKGRNSRVREFTGREAAGLARQYFLRVKRHLRADMVVALSCVSLTGNGATLERAAR